MPLSAILTLVITARAESRYDWVNPHRLRSASRTRAALRLTPLCKLQLKWMLPRQNCREVSDRNSLCRILYEVCCHCVNDVAKLYPNKTCLELNDNDVGAVAEDACVPPIRRPLDVFVDNIRSIAGRVPHVNATIVLSVKGCFAHAVCVSVCDQLH